MPSMLEQGPYFGAKPGGTLTVNNPVQKMGDKIFMATVKQTVMALELTTGVVQWESEPVIYRDYMTINPSTSGDSRRPNFIAKNGRIILQVNSEILHELAVETGQLKQNASRLIMMGAMGTITDFDLLDDSFVDI